jgi:hypothetical protein
MTVIEIVVLVVAALGLLLAYQAHHNGLSISAQAKADVAQAKSEATTLAHDLEVRVVALETKVGLAKASTPAPAAPAAPAPVSPPPATGS